MMYGGRSGRKAKPNDAAAVAFDLHADLSCLFNWNTKELFLYVTVEYETEVRSRFL